MTTRSSIPVDDLLVDEVQPTDEEYRAGLTAHQRAKEKVLQGPKARARYEAALAEARAHQAGLARLRKARALAQATVAELMGMNQSEVSKLERRSDMLMSTMRRFVEATGGTLRLVAVYPEGSVELRVGAELPPVEQEPISTRERSGAKATVRVVRAQKTMAAKGAAPVRGTHSKCGARFDVDWWSLLPWPLQCANARAQISYRVGKGHEAVFHSPPRGREGLRRLASVLKVEVPRRQK